MKYVQCALWICLIVLTSVTHAADTQFVTRTLIGTDTIPPTVPTGLVATPVATTQIDLSWDDSTDDNALSGYQVFRDAVQIATTTLTTYSDVGLTPSTTYSYFVTAFDWVLNVSGSSTVVSTTTLKTVTPTPTATTTESSIQSGSVTPLEIIRLEVLPEHDAVVIRYETRGYVRAVLRWGKGVSYELGSLRERAFTKLHETRIVGLQPGTLYTFSIEGENNIGIYRSLITREFKTLAIADVIPPSNVAELSVTQDVRDVVLNWSNPTDPDFSHIRVLRSTVFYPSDLADGWVVYEGSAETARDVGVVVPNERVYYTVFAYDELGNVSSGAITSFMVQDGTTTVALPPPVVETTNPIQLYFSDIQFIQDGAVLPSGDGRVVIDGSKHLLIAIPYERLPEHLKTIVVSLESSADTGKTLDFLLRVNQDKTAFAAYVAPLGIRGEFPVTISVFDYKTAQIGYTKGLLISEIVSQLITRASSDPVGFLGQFSQFMAETNGYAFLFLCLLIVLLFLSRRLLHAEW